MKHIKRLYISNLIPENELERILSCYSSVRKGITVGIEEIHFSISAVLDEISGTVPESWEHYGSQLRADFHIRRDRPLSLHGPFLDLCPATFDSQIRGATKFRFEQAYRAAEVLNADRIIFHTGFIPVVHFEESWIDHSILFWRDFLKDKDGRIQVHLENVQDRSPEPMIRVLDAVDNPFFTACLDVGHVNRYSDRPVSDWISAMENRIGHVHLHNNDGTADLHLADGTLDLVSIAAHIMSVSPTAGITLEIVEPAALERLLEMILRGRAE